jgi:hypothetical protein
MRRSGAASGAGSERGNMASLTWSWGRARVADAAHYLPCSCMCSPPDGFGFEFRNPVFPLGNAHVQILEMRIFFPNHGKYAQIRVTIHFGLTLMCYKVKQMNYIRNTLGYLEFVSYICTGQDTCSYYIFEHETLIHKDIQTGAMLACYRNNTRPFTSMIVNIVLHY